MHSQPRRPATTFRPSPQLETLIAMAGPTPERLGLMGGRYKRLINAAASPSEKRQSLAKAIDCYERGMELDLNAYYCSSNLPRLYRTRAKPGDEERAQTALRLAIAACERARRLNVADEWLRPTLLAAAFDLGEPDKAEELVDDVMAEGPAAGSSTACLMISRPVFCRSATRRSGTAFRRHRPNQGRLTAGQNACDAVACLRQEQPIVIR